MFYTYAHYTADTNEIFYIGKGQKNRYKAKDSRNVWWQRKAQKYGFVAKILAHWETEEDAYVHEEFLIACFKDMGIQLTNVSSGGGVNSGWKHTEEFKQKIAEVHRGKKKKPESIEKTRQANLGRVRTEEERKKISTTLKGKFYGTTKKVVCTSTNVSYASVREAAKATGCQPPNIVKCCKGERKHTKGLSFKYDND